MTNEENQFFEEFCSMFENNYSNFLEEQKREFHDLSTKNEGNGSKKIRFET